MTCKVLLAAASQEISQSAARIYCPCLVPTSHSVSLHSEVFMLFKRIQKKTQHRCYFFPFLFDNLAQCGNLIYQGFILYEFIFVFHVAVKISTAENIIFSCGLFPSIAIRVSIVKWMPGGFVRINTSYKHPSPGTAAYTTWCTWKSGWRKVLPNQKEVELCTGCACGKLVILCRRHGEITSKEFSPPWASVSGCDGLSCTAVGWCSFCLNLVREVMNTLSPLTFEEPINSGGMLGSIQVVGINGSE